jgi:hypothetical protein
MNSPEWNSTAIFINYDEGGGYYDSVPPPVVGGQQLGFRVPLIMISPYAKENYVSSTPMNHASLLAFLDYNWRMPPLNSFVASSDIPIDMFTFGTSGYQPRPPFSLNLGNLTLPSTINFPLSAFKSSSISNLYPVQPQIPFNALNYSRSGFSSVNLSQMHTAPYVAIDTPYTPYYESIAFVGAYLLLLSSLAVVVFYRKAGGKR